MRELSPKRQLAVNLVSSITALAINIGISFFLSSYIVKTIGATANGFIQLAANFINYTSIITLALNSMSGRFITIEYIKGNIEGAKRYYTSTVLANTILALTLVVPGVLCIFLLEKLVEIPPELITDVKILFSIVFINYLIALSFSSIGIAYFVKNKLYIDSLRSAESFVIKSVLIVLMFLTFSPRVFFVEIASFIATLYIIFYNIIYKRRLLPDVYIKRKYFSFNALKEIISSGIWVSVQQGGHLLLSGLDLIIANIFIGPEGMGSLALAKMVPTILSRFSSSITSVFAPNLTILYAKKDISVFLKEMRRGMKITGILLTIPFTFILIFGESFFRLWVPSENAYLLHVLSVMTCLWYLFTSSTQCIGIVFTVTNKLKGLCLTVLFAGIMSSSTLLVLLNIMPKEYGLYIIAGTGSVYNIIRSIIYVIPSAAKCLGLKWNTFFAEVLYSLLCVLIMAVINFTVNEFIIINSWVDMVFTALFVCGIGFCINIMIVLNKEERKYMFNKIFMRKIDN